MIHNIYCNKNYIDSVYINSSYRYEYVPCTMDKVTTNSASQSKIGDNSQAEKKDLTLHYNEVPSMQQQTQFTCSLYISRAGLQDQGYGIPGDTLQYIYTF